MKCAPILSTLRLCLAVLPVLMLLAGSWGQSFAAEAMTVVICSDGAMKTVRIDPDGKAGHGPQQCRDCPACVLPTAAGPAQAADPARPADWRAVPRPRPVAAALPSRKAQGPLSRGPPSPAPWLNA